ncbi:hypothetical protein M5K25_001805 [Dendrobium thyrsiflorum]|uniref:Pentatricopeptide repeat-containing protein n=1 Tax=Dendrobium thyrsiflorum TaxID=117978 RepID=A0ABD0VRG5_DENTH
MSRERELISQLLEASTNAKSITQLHSFLLRCGLLTAADCFLCYSLGLLYAKFTTSTLARNLFDEISQPNSFLWNAMLRSHCRAQQWVETLRLLRRMAAKPSDLDAFTLPIALKACAALSELRHGRTIHAVAIKKRFLPFRYVCCSSTCRDVRQVQ